MVNKYVKVFRELVKAGYVDIMFNMDEFLEFSRSVFHTEAQSKIFIHLCLHDGATSKQLEDALELPEPTVHRVIHKFKKLNIIYAHSKKRAKREGGRKPIFWRLKEHG